MVLLRYCWPLGFLYADRVMEIIEVIWKSDSRGLI